MTDPDYAYTVGTMSIRAAYSGDATYKPVVSACKPLTVTKQGPTVTTQVRRHDGSVVQGPQPVGTLVHAWARVSGVGGTPTGSATVTVYSDTSCTVVRTSLSVTLSSGVADFSAFEYSATVPASGAFRVRYNGDAHFRATTGTCVSYVLKGQPTVKTKVYGGNTPETTIPIGGPKIVDRITVSGNFGTPTGKVFAQVFDNGTCTGMPIQQTGTVSLSGGTAEVGAFGGSTLPATGQYAFKAFYNGNASYLKRTGACEPFTLVKSDISVARIGLMKGSAFVTSLAVGATAYPTVSFNAPINVTAATGTVTVVTLGPQCSGVGVAKSAPIVNYTANIVGLTLTPSAPGSIWLAFGYSGDARYNKASLGCLEIPVTAATPAPGESAPPAVLTTPAPGSSQAPAASAASSVEPGASESPAASASAEASAGESAAAPSGAASVGPSATPAPSSQPATTTDAGPWLLIGAIVLVAIVVVVLASRAGRRSTPAA